MNEQIDQVVEAPIAPRIEPPSMPRNEASYKICLITPAGDGGMNCRVAHILSARVYSPPSAIRYASYEARQLGDRESLLAVVSPAGRLLAAIGKSGRRASMMVMRRARRVMQQAVPEVFGAKNGATKKRRTSRRPSARRGR